MSCRWTQRLGPGDARSSDWLTSGKEYLCYGVKSTLQPRRQAVEIESRIHRFGGKVPLQGRFQAEKGHPEGTEGRWPAARCCSCPVDGTTNLVAHSDASKMWAAKENHSAPMWLVHSTSRVAATPTRYTRSHGKARASLNTEPPNGRSSHCILYLAFRRDNFGLCIT